MELMTYFKEMSYYAALEERDGDVEKAQQTRDTRNASWARGVRAELRHQQINDKSWSWR
jgi:hypothetical protein